MPDLFGDLESPFVRAPRQAVTPMAPSVDALGPLARAFGHDHVLGYPRRNPEGELRTPEPPTESWLRRYAETHGLSQAQRFRQALHRLDRADRAAIADDLLREDAPNGR